MGIHEIQTYNNVVISFEKMIIIDKRTINMSEIGEEQIMNSKYIKRFVVSLITVAMFASSSGCGQQNEPVPDVPQEVVEDEPAPEDYIDECDSEDYPENFMEERVGKFSFDSYDEIISNLQDGEAYGYGRVAGIDQDILFITDGTFDGYGAPACMTCYAYSKHDDGKYECDGVFSTISTSTPITISKEGYVLEATHTSVTMYAYDKDTKALMVVEYVYVEWDENGDAGSYGGFIRDENSLNATETEIAADDVETFEQAFEAFDDGDMITFTVVGAGE